MFLKTEDTVFRAGGIHGAVFTIDWGDIGPVYFNQEPQGVEALIGLPLGDFRRPILAPRPIEG